MALHSEVARAIAAEVRIQLARAPAPRRRVDNAAYDAYLRGRYQLGRRAIGGVRGAIRYFQQAVDLDPGFAPVYAGLAGCYSVGGSGDLNRSEAMTRARVAAAKAIELDSAISEAYAARGWVKMFYDWDWDGADEDFRHAIDLNPSDSNAYHRYSHYLVVMGRDQEASDMLRKGLECDPFDVVIHGHMTWHFYVLREYDRAIEASRKALEMDPNNHYAVDYRGWVFLHQKRFEEAIKDYEGPPARKVPLACSYALASRTAATKKLMVELEANADRQNMPLGIAKVYTALGDKDKAFEWLDRALGERSYPLADLVIDPLYDPLRSDPRFSAVLRRMNLRATRD